MSLEVGKIIGSGGFGKTYIAKYNGKIVAMKLIDVQRLRRQLNKPESEASGLTDEIIASEIKALASLSKDGCSEYVVCFYDAIEYKGNNKYIAIIMEYIEGMELADWLSKRSSIPPDELKGIMYQLILGLSFIHGKGFAHRDIKGENIILTNQGVPKFIDFGFACAENCTGFAGTLQYLAPEDFQRSVEMDLLDEVRDKNLSPEDSQKEIERVRLELAQAKDVWSLAMVFYELANGYDNFPFYDDTPQHIMKAPEKPSNYTLDDGKINEFLNFMMINDWKQRPTINEVLLVFQEMFMQ